MTKLLLAAMLGLPLLLSATSGEEPVCDDVYLAGTDDGKWGFIDKTGKFVIPARFNGADRFSEGLAAVVVDRLWGYIDLRGEIVIKPQFADFRPFSEGLAPVRPAKSGDWGYVDRSGGVVIQPQFSKANGFSEGLALVCRGDRFLYIDKEARVVLDPGFSPSEVPGDFHDGWADGLMDTEPVFIDKSGKLLRCPGVDMYGGRFSHGILQVRKGRKWGYIDKEGRMAIPPRYDDAHGFRDGLACVLIGEKWGAIDTNGRLVVKPSYGMPFRFSHGIAAIRHEGEADPVTRVEQYPTTFIDKTGAVLFTGKYETTPDFGKDLALIGTAKGFCYINRTGKVVYEWRQPPAKAVSVPRGD